MSSTVKFTSPLHKITYDGVRYANAVQISPQDKNTVFAATTDGKVMAVVSQEGHTETIEKVPVSLVETKSSEKDASVSYVDGLRCWRKTATVKKQTQETKAGYVDGLMPSLNRILDYAEIDPSKTVAVRLDPKLLLDLAACLQAGDKDNSFITLLIPTDSDLAVSAIPVLNTATRNIGLIMPADTTEKHKKNEEILVEMINVYNGTKQAFIRSV